MSRPTSPKVDKEIQDLVREIEAYPGLHVTSSCAGRIFIYLDGQSNPSNYLLTGDNDIDTEKEHSQHHNSTNNDAGNGKADASSSDTSSVLSYDQTDESYSIPLQRAAQFGYDVVPRRFLFISHEAVSLEGAKSGLGVKQLSTMLGLERWFPPKDFPNNDFPALVHLRFEPIVLSIQTPSPAVAHLILTAAQQAGFRSSGATLLHSNTHLSAPASPSLPSTPLVTIRSSSSSLLSSVIGYGELMELESSTSDYDVRPIVTASERMLRNLLQAANARLAENTARTKRFRLRLGQLLDILPEREGERWEDIDVRRIRKEHREEERRKNFQQRSSEQQRFFD